MMECRVSTKIANASLLTELVHRIGKQPWTKAGSNLYDTLREAQKLEKADREAREAEAKARDEVAKLKLLPCPWCGEQAESFEVMRKWVSAGRFQYICENCSASGPMVETESEARLAWNTRGGKPQDRRQNGERRVATVAERRRYDQEAPWGLLRRVRQRRTADRPS